MNRATLAIWVRAPQFDAMGAGRSMPPYEAAVSTTWADVDVATRQSTWSSVKELFR